MYDSDAFVEWQPFPENWPVAGEMYLISYIDAEGKPQTTIGAYEDGNALWWVPELSGSLRTAWPEDYYDHNVEELDRVFAFAKLPVPMDIPHYYEEEMAKGRPLSPM